MLARVRTAVSRIAATFTRRRAAREFDEELEAHLALLKDKLIRQGMSPEEAVYAARRQFGGVSQVKQERHESQGGLWLETLLQDVRHALRTLARSPGFTAAALTTLALATGVGTAIFSVVDTVLLRPLPYRDSSRLVWVTERFQIPRVGALGPDFLAWQKHNRVFEEIAGFGGAGGAATLTGFGEPVTVGIRQVTTNLFPVLGVRPVLGRNFLAEEGTSGRDHVALLSEDLWRSRFGADPHVLGKTIRLEGVAYTVVGVMPGTLRYPDSDIWKPLAIGEGFSAHSTKGWALVTAIGRLKPGIGIDQAQANLQVITRQLAPDYPPQALRTLANGRVEVSPLQATLARNVRPLLLVLLGAVGSVLLIACANVANLLLSRGVVRSKEMALRLALGATRLRLIRQLLTESLLLSAMGTGAGFLVGLDATKALNQLVPPNFPSQIRLDWRVLTFSVVITVLASLLFGLLPAWTTTDFSGALKEGDLRTGEHRKSGRLRNLISVAQIALSLILLMGAGLLVQSFLRLSEVALGFEPHNLMLATIQRPPPRLRMGSNETAAFFTEVLERARSLPGVEGAAATMQYPMLSPTTLWYSTTLLSLPGTGEMRLPQPVPVTIIDPEYFRVMKIRLLQGRVFSKRDGPGDPLVAIVNESLARMLFQGRDPLGRRIRFPAAPDWMKIVGLVVDTRNSALQLEPVPEVYVPYLQQPTFRMTLVLRARNHPEALTAAVRHAVQQIDKNQPLFAVTTMDDVIARELAPRQVRMLLVVLFALLAVVLAAVGVYGVVSYSVRRRTPEFGVRLALGALPSDILKLVAGQGLKLTLIGLAVGIVGALALTRLLSSLLYDVSPRDPLTLVAVALILAAIALAASYIPARRAAKVDSAVALRHE